MSSSMGPGQTWAPEQPPPLQVNLDRQLLRNSGPAKGQLQQGATALMLTPAGDLVVGGGDGSLVLLAHDVEGTDARFITKLPAVARAQITGETSRWTRSCARLCRCRCMSLMQSSLLLQVWARVSPPELGRAQGHSETTWLPPSFASLRSPSQGGRTSTVRCDRDRQTMLRVLSLVELCSCRRFGPGASMPASQGAALDGCSLPWPGHRSMLGRSSCSMQQRRHQAALLHRCCRACQSSVRRGAASARTSHDIVSRRRQPRLVCGRCPTELGHHRLGHRTCQALQAACAWLWRWAQRLCPPLCHAPQGRVTQFG